MFLVGLTGGIASGKSTATKLFEQEHSCFCVDADLIARQVVEPGQKANRHIREYFGDKVFHPDGQLNRERLGQIIFHDDVKRRKLNSIVHPAVQRQMMWQIFKSFIKGYQFVILDIPLLYETKKMLPYLSYTIVVFCHEEQQLQRLMDRNHLTAQEAMARMKAQLPLSQKCQLGTYLIDNSGDLEQMRAQVKDIFLKLRASRKHLVHRCGFLVGAALVVLDSLVKSNLLAHRPNKPCSPLQFLHGAPTVYILVLQLVFMSVF